MSRPANSMITGLKSWSTQVYQTIKPRGPMDLVYKASWVGLTVGGAALTVRYFDPRRFAMSVVAPVFNRGVEILMVSSGANILASLWREYSPPILSVQPFQSKPNPAPPPAKPNPAPLPTPKSPSPDEGKSVPPNNSLLAAAKQQNADYIQQLDEKDKELGKTKQALAQAEGLAKKRDKRIEELLAENHFLLKEQKKAKTRINDLEVAQQALQDEKDALQGELDAEKQKIVGLTAAQLKLQGEKDALQGELNAEKQKIVDLNAAQLKLQGEKDALQEELNAEKIKTSALKVSLDAANVNIEQLQSANKVLEGRVEKAEIALKEGRAREQQLIEKNKQQDAQIQGLQEKCNTLTTELGAVRTEFDNKLEAMFAQFTKQLQGVTVQLNVSQQESATLKAENTTLKDKLQVTEETLRDKNAEYELALTEQALTDTPPPPLPPFSPVTPAGFQEDNSYYYGEEESAPGEEEAAEDDFDLSKLNSVLHDYETKSVVAVTPVKTPKLKLPLSEKPKAKSNRTEAQDCVARADIKGLTALLEANPQRINMVSNYYETLSAEEYKKHEGKPKVGSKSLLEIALFHMNIAKDETRIKLLELLLDYRPTITHEDMPVLKTVVNRLTGRAGEQKTACVVELKRLFCHYAIAQKTCARDERSRLAGFIGQINDEMSQLQTRLLKTAELDQDLRLAFNSLEKPLEVCRLLAEGYSFGHWSALCEYLKNVPTMQDAEFYTILDDDDERQKKEAAYQKTNGFSDKRTELLTILSRIIEKCPLIITSSRTNTYGSPVSQGQLGLFAAPKDNSAELWNKVAILADHMYKVLHQWGPVLLMKDANKYQKLEIKAQFDEDEAASLACFRAMSPLK